mgnify:CR=1 FL=1
MIVRFNLASTKKKKKKKISCKKIEKKKKKKKKVVKCLCGGVTMLSDLIATTTFEAGNYWEILQRKDTKASITMAKYRPHD